MRKQTYEELLKSRLQEDEAALPQNRFPVILILDNIRSMYNVGSIFRTADGVRTEAIYTVGYTPHPPRAEITKTALGATKTVPHKHFTHISDAIDDAKTQQMNVAVLELAHGARSIYELTKEDFPLAIVIGNEINGVSLEALDKADFSIQIPMLGAKHSLNAAVATGIALYECVRHFNDTLETFKPKL
jgi:23S rRNA (guanosine2251-2'-O)-methyltransferase